MSSENNSGRRFFTTSEVAHYCAVTNDGVLKWIKSGKLRAFSTPGGHYRVSAEDFRSFLEKYDIPVDEAFFQGTKRQRSVLVRRNASHREYHQGGSCGAVGQPPHREW